MATPVEPVFPFVLITASSGLREAQLLLSEWDVHADFDRLYNADVIVDGEGRRVAARRSRLEVDDASGPIVCGFCFERTWTPPRFPPRCDECAAENLCWSCRVRKAVEGIQPAAPLPRCNECRLEETDFVATPPQPELTRKGDLAAAASGVAWGLIAGAVVLLALRACGFGR